MSPYDSESRRHTRGGDRLRKVRRSFMRVVGLDHLVLITADVEGLLTFYTESLGMPPVRLEEWRRGEVAFPSVRVDEGTIIDLFQGERSGVNQHHFCVVVDGVDLDVLADSGAFERARGPVEVFGARGLGRSVYVEDPDGNVIELRAYPSTTGREGPLAAP